MSRKNSWAICAAMGAALVGGGSRCFANSLGTVAATLGNASPADIVNLSVGAGAAQEVYAGQLNWTTLSTTGGNSNPLNSLTSFGTYCVDISTDIYLGGSYNYAVVPFSSTASLQDNATAQTEIENLFYQDFSSTTNKSDTAQQLDDASAAFQIAIWELIYGTYNAQNNPNGITVTVASGQSNGWTSLVSQYLSDATKTTSADGSLYGLNSDPTSAYPNVAQDQALFFQVTPITNGSTTPLPSAFLAGSFLLGGILLRSRRSAAGAASESH